MTQSALLGDFILQYSVAKYIGAEKLDVENYP